MKKPILIVVILFLIQGICSGYTRHVFIDKEIVNATQIIEIIVCDYTSRMDSMVYQDPKEYVQVVNKMLFKLVGNNDSIYEYITPYSGSVNFTPYYDIAIGRKLIDQVPAGYWPEIGDTVLAVYNKDGYIDLFAEIIGKEEMEYIFWSPYLNSSWSVYFHASSPYKPVGELDSHVQEFAKKFGCEFGSSYHLTIDKKSFWHHLEMLKSKNCSPQSEGNQT